MRHLGRRFGTIGLLTLGTVIPIAASAAPDQDACRQIRAACESAGFAQGAARQGIGLQVHCMVPIMQGRPQPPTARRPLPKVDPQLAANCGARVARFGRQAPPPEAYEQAQPGVQPYPAATAQPRPAPSVQPYPAPTVQPPAATGSIADAVQTLARDNAARSTQPARPASVAMLPAEDQPETGPAKALPPQFRRTTVSYSTNEPVGTLIVDTANTYLYLVLANGKAMRYGIGVGRDGFTWSGSEKVTRMAEWPDWHPPEEMIERQPYLPRFMAGGEGNPLGARALYLGQTLYRIHGTNQPSTIGTFVSSGCIRLTNDDVTDLYGRVHVGTRVVVLRSTPPASMPTTTNARPTATPPRPKSAKAEKPATSPAAVATPQAAQQPTVAKQSSAPLNETASKEPASPAVAPAEEQAE